MKGGYALLAISIAACFSAPVKADDGAVTAYLNVLADRMAEMYFPIPGTELKPAVAEFTLKPDGYTSDVTVIQSPKIKNQQDEDVHDAVSIAVRNAAPVPKPPAALQCPVRLTVTFSQRTGEVPATCTVQRAGSQIAGRAILTY